MSLKISRILHAGFVFEAGQTQIAFDPVFENPFSRNCFAFPAVKFDADQIRTLRFDAVFISHFHDDHCSLESLNLLDRRTPIYLFCAFKEMFSLIRELGFQSVYALRLNAPVLIGDFTVTPRRALDADVDSIFHIQALGFHILNVVDSWIDDETLLRLAETPRWDLVLWPFQTMREIEVLAPQNALPREGHLPPEWIQQLRVLNPRHVVPSSCQFIFEEWSWYNQTFFPISYEQFAGEVEEALPTTRVVRLDPSEAITLTASHLTQAPSLSWVKLTGEAKVDYDFDLSVKPSATAEIARNFPELEKFQIDFVENFCRVALLEKFANLPESEEPLFSRRGLWRLTLFDQNLDATDFYYRIENQKIKLVGPTDEPPMWRTEIPRSKLFAALTEGETLTSIYLRVQTDSSADVIEDPLIRCLYSGVGASYQRAQMKRLKAET